MSFNSLLSALYMWDIFVFNHKKAILNFRAIEFVSRDQPKHRMLRGIAWLPTDVHNGNMPYTTGACVFGISGESSFCVWKFFMFEHKTNGACLSSVLHRFYIILLLSVYHFHHPLHPYFIYLLSFLYRALIIILSSRYHSFILLILPPVCPPFIIISSCLPFVYLSFVCI